MGTINYYSNYVKSRKLLLDRGFKEGPLFETLVSSVSFLLFEETSSPLTHMFGRGEGKTTLCAALAVCVASSGQHVSYIPAYSPSTFKDYVKILVPNAPIKSNQITIGPGEIFIVRTQCLRGLRSTVFIFDDVDDNEKCWHQHCGMRPDAKNIGFRSRW